MVFGKKEIKKQFISKFDEQKNFIYCPKNYLF